MTLQDVLPRFSLVRVLHPEAYDIRFVLFFRLFPRPSASSPPAASGQQPMPSVLYILP